MRLEYNAILKFELIAVWLLALSFLIASFAHAAGNGTAFRADDANVSIAHNEKLEPSYTGKFTVSLWYKPESIMSNPLPRLWGKGANYIAVMGNYDNGKNSEHHRVGFEISNGLTATEFWARPTRLEDGKWFHILVSFDQDECLPTMQINGVLQTVKAKRPWCDKSVRQMKTNNKPVMIGNRTSFGRPGAGFIREVAYYDRILSSTERTEIYQGSYPSENLVYRLPMCDTPCSTISDISGNGYDGLVRNAEWD